MGTTKKTENPNPRLQANFFSKVFFYWLLPLFFKGSQADLQPEEIYNVLPDDVSETLGDKLQRNWNKELENERKKRQKPNFQRAILRTFLWSILYIGIYQFFFTVVLKTAEPIILGILIRQFSSNTHRVISETFLYATGVALTTLFGSIVLQQSVLKSRDLGAQLKIASSSLIYRKIMRLSSASLPKASGGIVVNLLSNDVVRFELVFTGLHYIWITPIQVIIISYLMYQTVGWASLLGVFFMIMVTVPFQALSGKKIYALRQKVARKTDRRVQLMNEIINGIRVIKMYTWESFFEKLINVARRNELNVIADINYLKGGAWASFYYAQRTAACVTIMVYAFQDNTVTSENFFTIFQYFSALQWTLAGIFPRGAQFYAEAKASIARIQDFLLLSEIEPKRELLENFNGRSTIRTEKITASWLDDGTMETLSKVNVTISDKDLCAIVGSVGAGKSSFLKLILGELSPKSGQVSVCGNISYASQEPWLFAASVRDNILFGQPFDKEKYNKVTKACCLIEDFDQLPYGDRTLVGEKGSSLSGGQCARVNLARAVYRDADIYLLDDPLSAVDTRVGKRLFKECINGYLKDKTRILVTHQIQFLKDADTVLYFEKGTIKYQGNFEGLQKYAQQFQPNDEKYSKEKSSANEEIAEMDFDILPDAKKLDKGENEKKHKETEESCDKKTNDISLYWKYFRASKSKSSLISIVFIFLVTQMFSSGSDYWVSYWVKNEEAKQVSLSRSIITIMDESNCDPTSTQTKKNCEPACEYNVCGETFFDSEGYNPLFIYGILVFGSAILLTGRNILLYMICKKSSLNIHTMMIENILRSPMKFFDTTSSGQILDRFFKDLGAVDEILSLSFVETIGVLSIMLGIVVQILIINWWLLVPMSFIVYAQMNINTLYLAFTQRLKKLESNSKSPILTQTNSTLQGLITIRSCSAEKMECKQFDDQQDLHSALFSLNTSTLVAFSIWIDLLSAGFITIVTFSFIVLDNSNYSGDDVGLAITQVLSICTILQYGMRNAAEVIAQMVTVQRLFEYTELKQEGPFESEPGEIPNQHWPEKGEIKFENLDLKYSDTSKPTLKNLNFCIKSGEKVGIVGRTGAGKSSLISTLFRLAENDGKLFIDGVDVNKIGLRELRSKLSIIPQEPILFSASLRDNLDPFHKIKDDILRSSLNDVKLGHIFSSLDQPLDQNNLSAGQRQLLCLARAIVKKSKILVLDEATANVDPATDTLIQKTIRLHFKNCTVLTIAHRLNTVIDSEKVLVMNFGEVVEFDHPHILLQNNGMFSQFVQQTGTTMAENLKTVAKETFLAAKVHKLEYKK